MRPTLEAASANLSSEQVHGEDNACRALRAESLRDRGRLRSRLLLLLPGQARCFDLRRV